MTLLGCEERAPEQAVLRVHALSKTFVDGADVIRACDSVNLDVAVGEFVLVRGPSGSGKSTLLMVCAGLIDADSGTAMIDGTDIVAASQAARAAVRLRRVGVVFQNYLLIEELTAIQNVRLPLEARGWTSHEAEKEARSWMDRVGVGPLGERLPHELSGGQRQRVAIARALVGGKKLILADEPTGALDSISSREIFGVLQGLTTEGITTIVASHDSTASAYASRICEMQDGRLTEASR